VLTLTLTPCRSTGPRRGYCLVMYRREGDRVDPYLVSEMGGPFTVEALRWDKIEREESRRALRDDAIWLERESERARVLPRTAN
jgi:hypothetical protein